MRVLCPHLTSTQLAFRLTINSSRYDENTERNDNDDHHNDDDNHNDNDVDNNDNANDNNDNDSIPQFIEGQRCWVSAWGNSLHEQREVFCILVVQIMMMMTMMVMKTIMMRMFQLEVPLVSKAECNKLLKPEFARRGVNIH